MAAYHFPVLLWKDFEGYYTACLAEHPENIAATAHSKKQALAELKEYIGWAYQEWPYQPEPDFLDARLSIFRTEVRAEYVVEKRLYPADKPTILRVAAVHGRQKDGLLVCSLPMLRVRFYYYETRSLKELVRAYVQEGLKGSTQQALSRFLMPPEVTLEELVVQVNRTEKTAGYKPELKILMSVAEPLADRTLRGRASHAWERSAEVADLVRRLSEEHANVVLVGESGVGKTAVLATAIREVERADDRRKNGNVEDEDGSAGRSRRFWLTSASRLIAGASYLGQWEERVEAVIDQLSEIDGYLCVPSLLDLILTGSSEPGSSVAAFFVPYLQNREIRLVAEATPQELEACHRLLPSFTGLFQPLSIDPLDKEKALTVLQKSAENLASARRITVSGRAADQTYRLFKRFSPYQPMPGAAVGFLTETLDRARVEKETKVDAESVTRQFVYKTGLLELFLRDDEPITFDEVVQSFRKQVIGQEAACDVAADLVMTFKAGLNDPGRPLGVLMFCGPTGVGKTEMAKAIAGYFFGHGDAPERLVRLDMSEYAGPGAADRLFIGPDGGTSDFIKRLRQQPFSVVLLDEIEKATPAVFDALLGALDDGRMTDRFGRTATLASAILVMTSNIGADKMRPVGFDDAGAPSYSSEVMSFFRPEFFNRIDSIVTFKALDRTSMCAITIKELEGLAKREGLEAAGIKLQWTDALVEHLAERGFDLRYGARPLQRTIESLLVAPLSRYLVDNPGHENVAIRASVRTGEVKFTVS